LTVDEFVESKVLPEFRPIVAFLRTLMKECAPEAREVMSYALPMYLRKSTVAWISPSKTAITFSFKSGVAFEDRYGLLRGVGKHAKGVRMRSLSEVNEPALRDYIEQALKIDESVGT
jgi:uncharacterized protein YdhG (YjbR/CyaY superfamily)